MSIASIDKDGLVYFNDQPFMKFPSYADACTFMTRLGYICIGKLCGVVDFIKFKE